MTKRKKKKKVFITIKPLHVSLVTRWVVYEPNILAFCEKKKEAVPSFRR